MPEPISSATDNLRAGNRVVAGGIAAIVLVLLGAAVFLFLNLPFEAMIVLPVWGVIGIVIYYLYGYRTSHVGQGKIEVHEDDTDVPKVFDPN